MILSDKYFLNKTRNEEKRSEGFSGFPDFGFFLFRNPNSKLNILRMFRMLQLHENLIDYLVQLTPFFVSCHI